jgi:hypothetical protein
MAENIVNGGRFKTAMDHAVGALGIATIAILLPIRLFHESLNFAALKNLPVIFFCERSFSVSVRDFSNLLFCL